MTSSPTTDADRRTLLAVEGAPVTVRPQSPFDGPTVRELLEGLSERSSYHRFLSPMPRIPDSLVAALCAVDGADHVAVLAERAGRPVGMARWIRSRRDPLRAELSLTVADDHQRRGLGRALLGELCSRAAAQGVEALTYVVSPENRGCLRLLATAGGRSRLEDGLVEGELDPAAVVATTPGRARAS